MLRSLGEQTDLELIGAGAFNEDLLDASGPDFNAIDVDNGIHREGGHWVLGLASDFDGDLYATKSFFGTINSIGIFSPALELSAIFQGSFSTFKSPNQHSKSPI